MNNDSKSTFNPNIPIKCYSYDEGSKNDNACIWLRSALTSIGELIDISSLVDVSIGYGDEAYKQAIIDIDPNRKPSSGAVVGVAMTLDKVNNGQYANHIVLHQDSIYGFIIEDPSETDISFSLQTLAHECAHVYSNSSFYEIFGNSFEQNSDNPYHQVTRSISSATWSEYSACLMSADIGLNPTQDFLTILCDRLDDVEQDISDLLQQKPSNFYLLTGIGQILGNIVKFAGYFLGCIHAFGNSLKDCYDSELIKHEWFIPYLYEIEDCLIIISNKFGDNSIGDSDLLQIGNIFIEMAESLGFYIGNDSENGAYIFTNHQSDGLGIT